MVLLRDGAHVIRPPPRPSQEQPREESEGGREQWAMSGAVGRGPGLAGGGHMASGGHNPGRQARDDRDDCKSSQEDETVSRVTVGKAPLSFHIREVVKSMVRPGPDSVLHRRGSRPRLQRAGVHALTNASGHPLHLPTILPHGTLVHSRQSITRHSKMNIYYCTVIFT